MNLHLQINSDALQIILHPHPRLVPRPLNEPKSLKTQPFLDLEAIYASKIFLELFAHFAFHKFSTNLVCCWSFQLVDHNSHSKLTFLDIGQQTFYFFTCVSLKVNSIVHNVSSFGCSSLRFI